MKKCIRCKQYKGEDDFGWHNKANNWRRTVCKVCRNIDARNYRKQSEKEINDLTRDRLRERKLYWINEKGGCCSVCGCIFHPSVYDFHHKDVTKKRYSPGQMFSRNIETVAKEMENCILICSNCHRALHNDY